MVARSKLSVILHADVVGSTTLVQKDEQIAHERIQAAFRGFARSVEAYGGNVTELRGDAFLAEFARGSDAVLAALSAQEANARANDELDDDIRPVLRVGIALGEVVYADDTVTGAGVVLAQRLEQMARPGGICVSAAIRESVPTRLPFDYEDLGPQEAKGFDHPVHTFAVSPREGHPIPHPSQDFTATTARSRRRGLFAGAIGVVALVAVGAWLAWETSWKDRTRLPLAIPDKPSVAVLPFSNMSGDPGQEYFSDGFTEDIITGLSSFHDLFVIARNSSFKFKGQNADVRQVATDLGVRYVLEGSVRKAGEKVLINAQLIDAGSGSHLWAKRYDVDAKELLAIQDEVTQQIVSTLVSKVRSTDTAKVKRKRESDLTAYEYLLQARDLFREGGKETSFRAQEMAKKSIQLDPGYAPAHAMLSFTYYKHFVFRWGPPEALELARESAQKAIELDNSLAEGYDMLARVYSRQRQHDDSVATLEKAVSLNPNRAETYLSLANTLTFAGRPLEAVDAVRKAMRLDPFHGYLGDFYLGRALYFAKRYEEALLPLKTCVARAPQFPAGYMYLAPLYAELGRIADADHTVAKLLELAPKFTVEASVQNHLPYVPQAMSHYVQGLRKAGVPER
jgi:adenylate cyclase